MDERTSHADRTNGHKTNERMQRMNERTTLCMDERTTQQPNERNDSQTNIEWTNGTNKRLQPSDPTNGRKYTYFFSKRRKKFGLEQRKVFLSGLK